MSSLANKLSSIEKKKQKLKEAGKKLIQKRKLEVADLVEKFDLLVASDAFLAGLFKSAKEHLESKSEQMKKWAQEGDRYLKPRKAAKEKTGA